MRLIPACRLWTSAALTAVPVFGTSWSGHQSVGMIGSTRHRKPSSPSVFRSRSSPAAHSSAAAGSENGPYSVRISGDSLCPQSTAQPVARSKESWASRAASRSRTARARSGVTSAPPTPRAWRGRGEGQSARRPHGTCLREPSYIPKQTQPPPPAPRTAARGRGRCARAGWQRPRPQPFLAPPRARGVLRGSLRHLQLRVFGLLLQDGFGASSTEPHAPAVPADHWDHLIAVLDQKPPIVVGGVFLCLPSSILGVTDENVAGRRHRASSSASLARAASSASGAPGGRRPVGWPFRSS